MPVGPVDLKCEYQVSPLGLGTEHPRFFWRIADPRRGAAQTAYRVQVAMSPRALAAGRPDAWDSGRVSSSDSTQIEYGGSPLQSSTRYGWRVQTWDAAGRRSAWSRAAWFETGLLEPSLWQAKWIGSSLVGGTRSSVPCPYLRRTFKLPGRPVRARLYISAIGLYEAWINGRQVGDDVFTPGWTDYRHRIQYQTYDVTGLLKRGRNALGAVLGDGWACGCVGWFGRQRYFDRPRLLAQLEVDLDNGKEVTLVSDESWAWRTGPILEADLLMGESHDARLRLTDWLSGDDRGEGWQPVSVFAAPDVELVVSDSPRVRRMAELKPVGPAVDRPRGARQYDFGQNFAGRVRIRARGKAGQTISVRHAEMLDERGDLYTANLRSARATDYYTFAGDGVEEWEPAFTFHGFRYMEIAGVAGAKDFQILGVTGVVLHTALETTGRFASSHPLLNQLQSCIQWGQRSNYLEAPTDCPQRDERLGWTGDAQVFVKTAAFNMNVAPFMAKFTTDLQDGQTSVGAYPATVPNVGPAEDDGGPAWAEAGVICPWTIYSVFGDLRILESRYASMQRFLGYLESTSRNLIRPFDGYAKFKGYGDWLATDAPSPGRAPTPKSLIGTAYFARSADLMQRVAQVLGREDDARRYGRLAQRIRRAFQREFVTASGRVGGFTQTGYLLALGFDLLTGPLRDRALKHLLAAISDCDDHLSTGFVGTPLIAPVLTACGRSDVAYKVVMQETYPGWLYTMRQGATTMWERWNSWTKESGFGPVDMNSFNHYAYGAIGQWLYATVAGLDVDDAQPGGRRFVIAPEPGGGLTWAEAEWQTLHGRAVCGWRRKGKDLAIQVVMPPNTTAGLRLKGAARLTVLERGKPLAKAKGVSHVRTAGGALTGELAAGEYKLLVRGFFAQAL